MLRFMVWGLAIFYDVFTLFLWRGNAPLKIPGALDGEPRKCLQSSGVTAVDTNC